MNFRTSITLTPYNYQFSHEDCIFCLGSCFAENISKKLSRYAFDVSANPFGVVYNPLSVCNTMKRIINSKPFTEEDLNFNTKSGNYFSYDTHTLLNGQDKHAVLDVLNKELHSASENLRKSRFVVVTLGTSFVYRLTKTGKVVANCQKQPSSEFSREKMSVDDVYKCLKSLFSNEIFETKQIILTVSPIRHIKDGFTANSVSKSTLLCAVSDICTEFNNISYFPSYEIMMDDLRDYRFYAEDMIHPSETAINYIWEQFKARYIDGKAQKLFPEIEIIQKGLTHRPFNPESESHAKFLNNLNERINLFNKKIGKKVF